MGFKDILSPKDTEEVKPGLFIQKKGSRYRVVEPLVWNGNYRWKEQIKTIFSMRTILSLGLILFIVWAYLHDTSSLRDFYFKVSKNPVQWCSKVMASIPTGNLCTEQWEEFGLCETEETLNKSYNGEDRLKNLTIYP